MLIISLTCLVFRRPSDWTVTWGGSGTIYGWGHNHRGQLGGIEGGKVKFPQPCEALSAIRPVQIVGGEQTLFAVTSEGKVCIPLEYVRAFSLFSLSSFLVVLIFSLTLFQSWPEAVCKFAFKYLKIGSRESRDQNCHRLWTI